MYNFEELQKELRNAVVFASHLNVNLDKNMIFRTRLRWKIHDKIQNLTVEHGIRLNFKDPKYIGHYDIADFNGIQLLSLFISIINNKKLCQEGNGVLFTLKGQYAVAVMLILRPHWIEIVTAPPPKDEPKMRYIFTKLFDDAKTNHLFEGRRAAYEFYSPEVITRLRDESKVELHRFLRVKFCDFDLFPFGCAFLGLLCQIALTEKLSNDPTKMELNALPVAACIKIAFDQRKTGMLKNIFGESLYKECKWNVEAVREIEILNINREDHQFLLYKLNRRQSAVKEFILKAIPPNEEGLWDEETVRRTVKEIKDFYQSNY